MAIYKYTASADNTISNAFDSTLSRRATGSNMGNSDIIEVFSLYAQDSGSAGLSSEIQRGLIKFDVASIKTDRDNGVIPATGSVNFFLNIYNCPHTSTTPHDFKFTIAKITSDWEEGFGHDMDEYSDFTYDGVGSTWNERMGTDIPEISKYTFSSDSKAAYSADTGTNYVKIYDGASAYNFWFNATDAATYETSSFQFISNTDTDYLAGAGSKSVAIYNGSTAYNFWFGKDVINASTTITFDSSNFATAPGSTITINGMSGAKTYTAKASGADAASREFNAVTSANQTAINLAAIINDTTHGHGSTIATSLPGSGVLNLTLASGGTSGNTKAITTSAAVAASMTLTFDGSNHNIAPGSKITLIAGGKTVEYEFVAYGSSGLSATQIELRTNSKFTADAFFQKVVNDSNGHQGKLTGQRNDDIGVDGKVILTHVTAGDDGDTTITTSAASVATAVDALDMAGHATLHQFTVTVPVAAGGTGNPIKIKVTNGPLSPLSDEIHVIRGYGVTADRDLLIEAITGGGNATNTAKIQYGSNTAGDSTNGIAGLTATPSGTTKITLATTTAHLGGNSTSVANNTGTIWTGVSFTGGLNAFTDSTSINPPATFTGGIDAFVASLTGAPSNFGSARDADTAGGLSNAVKVNIQGKSAKADYATEFKNAVDASAFTATLSSPDTVKVTPDTVGATTDTFVTNIADSILNPTLTQGADEIPDTVGSISSATTIDIRSLSTSGSIATAFRNAVNSHDNFTASITNNIVYVTSSATGPMTASAKVGTLAGLAVVAQQSGSLVTPWTNYGGDFSTSAGDFVDVSFAKGTEDISVDVTDIIESWITTPASNYGFMVKLSSSYEPYHSASDGSSTATLLHNTAGAERSYYTKKLFGRGTEFFYKRPMIEARWDDSRRDNRANFYFSSSVAPAASNLNRLFYYNYIRGKLTDINGDADAQPTMQLYHASGSVPEGSVKNFVRSSDGNVQNSISGTRVSKGVYKVEITTLADVVSTTYPYLVDVWSYSGTQVHTGSFFEPKSYDITNTNPDANYVLATTNLKSQYAHNDTARIRLYTRDKNWSPSIYTKAQTEPERKIIESGSYSVVRIVDDKEVIPYGTGSLSYTSLSYDASGSYFDLNMSLLEPGYMYGLKFTFYEDSVGDYVEQPYTFKFKVNKNVD